MDGREFAEFIKEQAKLHGIKDFELEAAVGSVLTSTVKKRVLVADDPIEATKRYLMVIVTIMKCFGITAEMMADPKMTKVLGVIDKMLENATPDEDENSQ